MHLRIRDAIAAEREPLLRSIAVLVAKTGRDLHWPEGDGNGLGDPERSGPGEHQTRGSLRPDPFGHGLDSRHRREAALDPPTRRSPNWSRISAAVLGEEAWAAAIGQRCTKSTDAAVAGRLDLEQALDRISPEERRAIEFRYYQGLDGEELATALGVSTPGAARVRVCRAVQALRNHFVPAQEEVFP